MCLTRNSRLFVRAFGGGSNGDIYPAGGKSLSGEPYGGSSAISRLDIGVPQSPSNVKASAVKGATRAESQRSFNSRSLLAEIRQSSEGRSDSLLEDHRRSVEEV